MSATPTPPSPSGKAEPPPAEAWPALPVETEIYILPDGRVVVADLPAELAALAVALAAPGSQLASPSTPTVTEQQESS